VKRAENSDETLLLHAVASLAAELHDAGASVGVGLDTRLDAELGLDSLALVELRVRVEELFGVLLPDRLLATAATPRDWLRAISAAERGAAQRGTPTSPAAPRRPVRAGGPSMVVGSPSDAQTLVEALAWHVSTHPDSVGVRLIEFADAEPTTQELTHRTLWDNASVLASGLHRHGIVPKGTVGIMLPTGVDYFTTFVGVLLAGGIPVPLYPPARPSSVEDHLRRQAHILDQAGAGLLVVSADTRRLAHLLRALVPPLRVVATPDELCASAEGPVAQPQTRPDDVALIQYTSGSTGRPKGVVLAHRHLASNIEAMVAATKATAADVFVSWLPLYHDMGLIASWFGSLFVGYRVVVMSPVAFLARPVRWLQALSTYGGTMSASPNFGYELCVRYVTDADLLGLDLSSWRLAFNGAEPVRAETMARFSERFAATGFRPEAMTPVYGLAEAGLGVTFPPLGRGPVVDSLDRGALARDRVAAIAAAGDPAPLAVVSCGQPLAGYEVRIVDDSGHELAARHEGRVEFRGPSATPGYFADPDATAALHDAGWLDTGDLGYLADGELYLTGRSKDLVIRAGRNLHPEELEEAVEGLQGVRKGCVAVFSSPDPRLATERLVVVAETRLRGEEERAALRRRIMATTVAILGGPPDDVVLAPPGTVLKTSSGKVRRSASRELYERGGLGRDGARWQVVRLAARAVAPQLRRTTRAGADLAYAFYAWGVVIAIGVPTWALLNVVPRLRWRWSLLRWAGNLLARMAGVEVLVERPVPDDDRLVVVANHTSFVDGLAVVLAAPSPVAFVAGGDLESQRIAGPVLKRLGCEFVHPGDPVRAYADTERFVRRLQGGERLAFFPEGSLSRTPGLREFHLGAFAAACQSGAAVVPIGIAGSREIVRPGSKLPRRGSIRVSVGEPVVTEGTDWSARVALRNRARVAVAELSGERQLVSSG
jgi:1-acyl-sn-glycerol-3-phosphate acyltransferase